MPKSITPTEHEIQGAIIDLIRARGGVVTRVNSGSIIVKRGDKTYVVKLADEGTSDTIAVYKSIALYIEVKKLGKKPTPDQIAFLESVAEADGVGLVAYDSETVNELLNRIDVYEDKFYLFVNIEKPNQLFVKG
jgi:hypothetical protein